MHRSSDYIELHARSAFSWHRGSSKPETLVERAAELGLPALALCDRDGVYGSARLHYAGKEHGVRGIVGTELTLTNGTVLPVLVKTRTGYQNLCRLLTRAKLRAAKNESQVTWTELREYGEGLVALTGDEEGPVRHFLDQGDRESARENIRCLLDIFGPDHLYVELQRHRARGETPILRELVEFSREFQLPPLATNGVLYAAPTGRALMDAFTCLRLHTRLDQAKDQLCLNRERCLKSAERMSHLFASLPEAITHTRSLAEQLEFTLEDLGYRFPQFPTPNGESAYAFLRDRTYEGARSRYPHITTPIRRQLEHELTLIHKLGFEGYFLIVWDLVQYARTSDILVQGRGSAANSAVCYCLGITAVDPIGNGLLFERFLSEGRNAWPDIDLDLPSGDRRERVIQEVYRRFAPYGAAMTANVITYRGRSAFREMAKVLDFPEDTISRFSDLFSSGDFPHTLELQDQIRQSGVPVNHPRITSLVQLYQSVYGLPRHLGQHSGGMVMCTEGLDSIVPLENATMPGRSVLQWDKDDCEDLGIIKVDLLGLGMMAAIQDSLTLCTQRGHPVDLATVPKDDRLTFEMMQRADTIGVFQIESRAQMATLPRMKPRNFYDIAIEVSLVRPGPITGDLTHPYLDRRDGKQAIDYIHPSLTPVLKRTLGVPLFQEQVLRMAMILADFTGTEAEELRRAMGFKRDDERLQKVGVKLRQAMQRKGIGKDVQDKMVKAIGSFALYGFPESHAVSFGLLAYVSTWLKAHRGAEFYTALLNNQPMGFYSSATLIKDARRHGIKTRAVSIFHSLWETQVVDDHTLQLGLHQVKGLSRNSGERIVQERRRNNWSTLDDFIVRTEVSRDERRVLAQIGALNGLAKHRRDALWNVERTVHQQDLFYAAEDKAISSNLALDPMKPFERLHADYQGLELSTGPHPMSFVRKKLPNVWLAKDILSAREGQILTIAGMVICRQRPGTAKGNLFLSLEDETGISNAFVPRPVFEQLRLLIVQEPVLQVTGPLQLSRGSHSVLAQDIQPIRLGKLQATSHDFH
ncbi:MAG: error-prone DNA polymerase [Verrucomicrobiota bacterium]